MFTVLMVCTGNLCRSAIAEQLLRARLAEITGIGVASAGTWANAQTLMPEQAIALSRRLGGDPTGHATERLTEQHLADASLVLAATREHRAEVARLLPSAQTRSYTMTQFARLADSLSDHELENAGGLDALLPLVASRRGYVRPERPEDDDIEDPYQRSQRVYDRVGAIIDAAMNSTSRALRAAAGGEAL